MSDNVINGTQLGSDIIEGTDLNDHIMARGQDDTVDGGAGNDTIEGNGGNDILNGGDGNDTIYGGIGDDIINGGTGNDYIEGNGGNDKINGGAGSDTLWGNSGNDIFQFSLLDVGTGSDTILNYQDGGDLIELLDGLTFSDLTIVNNGTSSTISKGADLIVTITFAGQGGSINSADFV